jgi:hypothetical protein
MRTALYIAQPTTVTIRTDDPLDAKIAICRYHQPPTAAAAGTHQLEPGIYLIVSRGPLEVTSADTTVVTSRNDKDIWPEPKGNVLALEPGATVASVQEFFEVAKDISPDD